MCISLLDNDRVDSHAVETSDRECTQAAEDSVERLLSMSQSAKMWLRGELLYEDLTDDGWYDMGVGRPYASIQVI